MKSNIHTALKYTKELAIFAVASWVLAKIIRSTIDSDQIFAAIIAFAFLTVAYGFGAGEHKDSSNNNSNDHDF